MNFVDLDERFEINVDATANRPQLGDALLTSPLPRPVNTAAAGTVGSDGSLTRIVSSAATPFGTATTAVLPPGAYGGARVSHHGRSSKSLRSLNSSLNRLVLGCINTKFNGKLAMTVQHFCTLYTMI